MEVFKKTVSTVFGTERRYIIPLFQRPYVWTSDDQWTPLWDDIRVRAEHELIQGQRAAPPHFLGATVIQQRQSWGDELMAHDVIDGQQRLTTFQILLAAFRDIASARDDKQLQAWLTSLTHNANAMTEQEVERFKVWPTQRDAAQFRLVMRAGSKKAIEAAHPPILKRKRLQSRPRMVEAYLFFYEAIDTWLTEDAPAHVAERGRALRRVLDKHMHFVSIELEAHEDPQAIFETLNARGVQLLASDLLRNYVFQRAGTTSQQEALHAKYWARFEIPDDEAVPEGARFWEVEERQGRLLRARLDLCVHHYLSMKQRTEVTSGRLFPTYKEWIEGDEHRPRPFSSVEDEVQDFTSYADHFYGLLRPSAGTPAGRFATRLRALDTSTVYPLVLAVLADSALSASDRDGIFTDIESFLVRRLVCCRPAKAYNRLFLQVLRDFQSKPERTRASFEAILVAGQGENLDWPDDQAFEKSWCTVDAYAVLKPVRVAMILRAIDEALRSSKTEVVAVLGDLTVEHIMPQKWKAHWPPPKTVDLETAAEAREEVIHDFGNLTLLTQALNSAVSNGAAAQKLPAIAQQATMLLNAHFQGRSTWSEADIRARGQQLFQMAKKVWPRP
jgi:hypothetical protein